VFTSRAVMKGEDGAGFVEEGEFTAKRWGENLGEGADRPCHEKSERTSWTHDDERRETQLLDED
jgi:hypothetical protein